MRGLSTALLLLLGFAPAAPAADVSAIQRVVAAGQAAPGGGTFEHFGIESLPVVAPVNERGQIAFFATLLRGAAAEGFFLASRDRITRVAAEGDPAPDGGRLSGFGRHPIPALNSHGTVAFVAAVAGGRTVEGVFLAPGGRPLRSVAVAGAPAPGIASGTFASLDAPVLNDRDDVAFLATVRRGRDTIDAVYLRTRGGLRKVVAQGDPAPAGGVFAGFGPPVLNGRGEVAFAAVVEGRAAPGGLFVASGDGVVRRLVAAGDESPVGGIFVKFSERIALNDAGTVAFTALLKGARVAQVIVLVEGGRTRKVAALDEEAPGGGTFSHFGPWPALSRAGAVGFTASVDRGPGGVAVFVVAPARAARVAALGDALPGGRLASFGLHPVISLSASGAVTFASTPTATGEGVEGIFTVPVAPR